MLSDSQRDRLDAWVLAAAPRAVAYAVSLLHDRSRAEDVVQDCFYRLLRKAGEYDLDRDGSKLLFTAISRACINENTRRRQTVNLQAHGDENREFEPADPHTTPPDQRMQTRELHDAVGKALAQLPEMFRAALELRILGHGKTEIAEILGVTPSHAGVLVFRVRQQLAEVLAPFVGDSPRCRRPINSTVWSLPISTLSAALSIRARSWPVSTCA